jgi:hypothetical protein
MRRIGYSIVFAGFVGVGFSSTAYSFTLSDDPSVTGTLGNTIYYGGQNTYNGADVIGTSTFSIIKAVVDRTNANTLDIKIYTNYAGAPGSSAADGTNYGSLFLTPGLWTPGGTPADHYAGDNYSTNKEWSYAVTSPLTGNVGTSVPTGLYAIGTVGAAHNYGATGVPDYYTTANGKVVLANVNGDPVTDPNSGNNGFYFRQGEAVQYTPANSAAKVAGTSTTFSVGADYVEYLIVDNGLFGNSFALSWAMTCANDVIQGQVILPSTDLTTPLPGALPMFSAGLGMLGLMGWRKKRKKAAVAAA